MKTLLCIYLFSLYSYYITYYIEIDIDVVNVKYRLGEQVAGCMGGVEGEKGEYD
jgi:hypothetical protein